MPARTLRLRGFTLIELLVVVAIIALLIAILLPSLARAREQARIAKCGSNLKAYGVAAGTYTNDHVQRDFPWVLHNGYTAGGRRYSFFIYSEFIYGGGMPETEWTRDNWAYSKNFSPVGADVYRVEPQHRPFNPYMSSSVTWNRTHASVEKDITPFVDTLLDTFRCPSDSTGWVPWQGQDDPLTEPDLMLPTWRFWGSSYPINWYWPYYYNDSEVTRRSAEEGKTANYRDGKWLNILGGGKGIPSLGPRMMGRPAAGGWESKYVLFYENRVNEALEAARPRGRDGRPITRDPKNLIGWHRQKDRHSVLMLDGHAEYRTMDTRFCDGPGWTSWPNRPWKDDWAEFNDN